MKIISRVLLLVLSSIILTGCHTKNEKTVIKFASWGSQSEVSIIKPILKEFEIENPTIKVDFVHIPQNYFQKIHLLFASNLAPDVLFINNLYLPIYANAGLLQEFQRKDLTDFYPEAVETLSYKNKTYAIPRDISNLVIYYNKDIFDRYGIKYPSKYWTFDDFLILAKKLTKDTNFDGKTDIWGISFEEDLLFYLPYLMSEGGGVLSDDLTHSIIDTKESQKGLIFYADLRKKQHVAPLAYESASATMAQLFLQEKLAMHLSGRWMVPKYKEDAKFKWGVINFPKGDMGSIVPMDASGWAISKSSKHKAEAREFIDFLASKKNIEKFSKSGLITPARIDVAQGAFLEDKSINNKVFLEVIKTSKKTPVSINYNQVIDEMKEKTEKIFN